MVKENMIPSISEKCTTRMTRSRAAVSRASSVNVMLPPKVPTKQEIKKAIRCNSKRPASDENNPAFSSIYHQNKRRPVFKDVTNVLCDTSYRNCINASKIQTKNKIQASRVPAAKVTKVTPAAPGVSLRIPQDQEGTRKCMVVEETLKSVFDAQGSMFSLKSEEMQQSTESVIRGCSLADLRLEEQISRKPLQHPTPCIKDKAEAGENYGNGPKIKDIDSDHQDPLMCSLYAPNIYSNLRVAELIRRPCSNFMETV